MNYESLVKVLLFPLMFEQKKKTDQDEDCKRGNQNYFALQILNDIPPDGVLIFALHIIIPEEQEKMYYSCPILGLFCLRC